MLLAGIPKKRCCILPSAPNMLLRDFPVHKLPVEIKEDSPTENRACCSELARARGSAATPAFGRDSRQAGEKGLSGEGRSRAPPKAVGMGKLM